jgi:hypothetical protein
VQSPTPAATSTEPPSPEPSAEPSPEASPTATQTPALPAESPAPSASPTLTPTPAGSDRYTPSDGELVFDWRMLVDTLVLGLSWSWLCCGVLLLVAIPVGIAVMYVMNKRRQEQE